MKLEILQEAEGELKEAVARYEGIEPGLGVRLKEETRKTLRWIEANAERPRVRPKGYRRVNLKVFRKGSAGELRTQIIIAGELDYLPADQARRMVSECIEISRMLWGLIKSMT